MATGYSSSPIGLTDLIASRGARGFYSGMADGGYEAATAAPYEFTVPLVATCTYCRRETDNTCQPCEGCGAVEFK